MAKGKKTGGRDFQKGCKGGGRKALPKDVMEARNMSYKEMCKTVIAVRELTPKEVKQKDMESVPLGERVIMNAYAKMDYVGIKYYEDRLWGKAKESIDLELNPSGNIEIIIKAKEIEYDSENRD